MPAYRASEVRAPDRRFTAQLLEDALRGAVEAVSVQVPDELGGGSVGWGERLDVQQLTPDEDERRRKASYLAKYSTKSTEQTGGLLHRIAREEVDTVPVSEHMRRYLRAGFELHDQVSDAISADEPAEPMTGVQGPGPATFQDPNGLALRVLTAMSTDERVTVRLHDGTEHIGQITRRTADGLVIDTGAEITLADVRAITAAPTARQTVKRDPRDRRLAACAHALGYRGHCVTKSRYYSTSFTRLHQDRVDHVHEQLLARCSDRAQRELAQLKANKRITAFRFVGVGHLTTADAYLAAQAAARAREQRQLAREALYDHYNHSPQPRCETPQDPSTAGVGVAGGM